MFIIDHLGKKTRWELEKSFHVYYTKFDQKKNFWFCQGSGFAIKVNVCLSKKIFLNIDKAFCEAGLNRGKIDTWICEELK